MVSSPVQCERIVVGIAVDRSPQTGESAVRTAPLPAATVEANRRDECVPASPAVSSSAADGIHTTVHLIPAAIRLYTPGFVSDTPRVESPSSASTPSHGSYNSHVGQILLFNCSVAHHVISGTAHHVTRPPRKHS